MSAPHIDSKFQGETNKDFALFKYDIAYDCLSGLANHLDNWLGDTYTTDKVFGMMEELEEILGEIESNEDGSSLV